MKIKDQIKEIDICISQGRYEGALERINQLKAKKYNSIHLLIRQVRIYYLQQDYSKALEFIEKASYLAPDDLNLKLLNLDIAIKKKDVSRSRYLLSDLKDKVKDKDLIGFKIQFFKLNNEYQKAIECLKTQIGKSKNSDFQIFVEIGYLLNANKKFNDALIFYSKALEIDKQNYNAFYNRGITLSNLMQYDKAIESFQLALKIDSSSQQIYQELAGQYENKNDLITAEKILNTAIEKFQDNLNLQCIKAFLYQRKKDIKGAEAIYDNIIQNNPEFIRALNDKSYLLLQEQRYKEGWQYYQYRQKEAGKCLIDDRNIKNIDNICPDQIIDVIGEQGIGDHIFYSRLLQKMKFENNINVYVDQRITKLLQENYENIKFIDLNLFEYNPQNININIASLGQFYINHQDDIHFKNYHIKHNKNPKRKIIGISWFSENAACGQDKSIPLELFKKLEIPTNQKFYNLQYGNTENQIYEYNKNSSKNIIIDNTKIDKKNDLYELCKDIQDCEYIITVSNITAHLAGALGKKCYLLLPKHHGKMWYWVMSKNSSIWYPSITIITQEMHETWENSIDKLNKLIRA